MKIFGRSGCRCRLSAVADVVAQRVIRECGLPGARGYAGRSVPGDGAQAGTSPGGPGSVLARWPAAWDLGCPPPCGLESPQQAQVDGGLAPAGHSKTGTAEMGDAGRPALAVAQARCGYGPPLAEYKVLRAMAVAPGTWGSQAKRA